PALPRAGYPAAGVEYRSAEVQRGRRTPRLDRDRGGDDVFDGSQRVNARPRGLCEHTFELPVGDRQSAPDQGEGVRADDGRGLIHEGRQAPAYLAAENDRPRIEGVTHV